MVHRVSYTLAGQELILETGRLAKQANGSVYLSLAVPPLLPQPVLPARLVRDLILFP